MNKGKGFKTCLIIGAVLIAVGLIIMTVCFARGEKPSSLGRFFMSLHIGPGGYEETVDFMLEDVDDPELFNNVNGIRFEISVANITVKRGDIYSVEAKGFRAGAVTITRDGMMLVIRDDEYNRGSARSWTNSYNRSIVVTVPKIASYDEISLFLGVGDVKMDEITAINYNISVGTGNVTVDNAETIEADIVTGVGDVKVRGVTADDVDVSTGTGNVTFEGLVNLRGSFMSGVGDVTVQLVGDDYYAECSSGVGNVQAGENKSSGFGDKVTTGSSSASCSISAETGVGNVKLSLNS